jgi:ribosome-associated translation inhibitor RaiA
MTSEPKIIKNNEPSIDYINAKMSLHKNIFTDQDKIEVNYEKQNNLIYCYMICLSPYSINYAYSSSTSIYKAFNKAFEKIKKHKTKRRTYENIIARKVRA